VWDEVWEKNESPVFRHWDNTRKTFPAMVDLFHKHSEDILLNPLFFEDTVSAAAGSTFVKVKPIAQYKDGLVQLKYNVGCRGNGVDHPHWPKDLSVEVVGPENVE
jgi:hypothetical protein